MFTSILHLFLLLSTPFARLVLDSKKNAVLIINMILGFSDLWVFAGFVLTILSAVFCIFYGIRNWNRGGIEKDGDYREEIQWEREEIELIEKLP